jgi:hypothetical protein
MFFGQKIRKIALGIHYFEVLKEIENNYLITKIEKNTKAKHCWI